MRDGGGRDGSWGWLLSSWGWLLPNMILNILEHIGLSPSPSGMPPLPPLFFLSPSGPGVRIRSAHLLRSLLSGVLWWFGNRAGYSWAGGGRGEGAEGRERGRGRGD